MVVSNSKFRVDESARAARARCPRGCGPKLAARNPSGYFKPGVFTGTPASLEERRDKERKG